MSDMNQTVIDRAAVARVMYLAMDQGKDDLAVQLIQLVKGSDTKGPSQTATPAKRGPGRPRSTPSARGEKRDPDELAKLAAKVRNFVTDNEEGVSVTQIRQALNMTTKELTLPIKKLVKDGVLRTKGEKRGTTYHLTAKAKNKEV